MPQPPSVALIGPAGSGKTTSIATFLEAGIEVFFLGTEPNATDAIEDAIAARNLDRSMFHAHQIVPASPGWDAIEETVRQVHNSSYDALTKMTQGIAKRNMTHLQDFVNTLKDFVDDDTGVHYGDVTMWGDDRAFVLDSLSGLNKMAREYTVGYKPTMHQGEWGVAMQLEENIIYKLTYDRGCYFVMIAHIDREVDEVQGGSRITMAALGRKLAPQLVKYFSEVVLVKREENRFYWSTSEVVTDVKNRALPISDKLAPTFAPIVAAHMRRRNAAAGVTST